MGQNNDATTPNQPPSPASANAIYMKKAVIKYITSTHVVMIYVFVLVQWI